MSKQVRTQDSNYSDEPPEWFQSLAPPIRRYVGNYYGYPEEWINYGVSSYTPKAVRESSEWRSLGFISFGAGLAPSYIHGMFERAVRAGWIPPPSGFGGWEGVEKWTYQGRQDYYGKQMIDWKYGESQFWGAYSAKRYGEEPSDWAKYGGQTIQASQAYWQFQQNWTPIAETWGATRLTTYAIPELWPIRAFGYGVYGAEQRVMGARATAPAMRGVPWEVARKTSAGWMGELPTMAEAGISSMGEWTIAQVTSWALMAALRQPGGITARVGAMGRSFAASAGISMMQPGLDVFSGVLGALYTREAWGMPLSAPERANVGQMMTIGAGMMGAGVGYQLSEAGNINQVLGKSLVKTSIGKMVDLGLGVAGYYAGYEAVSGAWRDLGLPEDYRGGAAWFGGQITAMAGHELMNRGLGWLLETGTGRSIMREQNLVGAAARLVAGGFYGDVGEYWGAHVPWVGPSYRGAEAGITPATIDEAWDIMLQTKGALRTGPIYDYDNFRVVGSKLREPMFSWGKLGGGLIMAAAGAAGAMAGEYFTSEAIRGLGGTEFQSRLGGAMVSPFTGAAAAYGVQRFGTDVLARAGQYGVAQQLGWTGTGAGGKLASLLGGGELGLGVIPLSIAASWMIQQTLEFQSMPTFLRERVMQSRQQAVESELLRKYDLNTLDNTDMLWTGVRDRVLGLAPSEVSEAYHRQAGDYDKAVESIAKKYGEEYADIRGRTLAGNAALWALPVRDTYTRYQRLVAGEANILAAFETSLIDTYNTEIRQYNGLAGTSFAQLPKMIAIPKTDETWWRLGGEAYGRTPPGMFPVTKYDKGGIGVFSDTQAWLKSIGSEPWVGRKSALEIFGEGAITAGVAKGSYTYDEAVQLARYIGLVPGYGADTGRREFMADEGYGYGFAQVLAEGAEKKRTLTREYWKETIGTGVGWENYGLINTLTWPDNKVRAEAQGITATEWGAFPSVTAWRQSMGVKEGWMGIRSGWDLFGPGVPGQFTFGGAVSFAMNIGMITEGEGFDLWQRGMKNVAFSPVSTSLKTTIQAFGPMHLFGGAWGGWTAFQVGVPAIYQKTTVQLTRPFETTTLGGPYAPYIYGPTTWGGGFPPTDIHAAALAVKSGAMSMSDATEWFNQKTGRTDGESAIRGFISYADPGFKIPTDYEFELNKYYEAKEMEFTPGYGVSSVAPFYGTSKLTVSDLEQHKRAGDPYSHRKFDALSWRSQLSNWAALGRLDRDTYMSEYYKPFVDPFPNTPYNPLKDETTTSVMLPQGATNVPTSMITQVNIAGKVWDVYGGYWIVGGGQTELAPPNPNTVNPNINSEGRLEYPGGGGDWEASHPGETFSLPGPGEVGGPATTYGAQRGFSGLVTRPTRLLVAERGAEYVSVVPAASAVAHGAGGVAADEVRGVIDERLGMINANPSYGVLSTLEGKIEPFMAKNMRRARTARGA